MGPIPTFNCLDGDIIPVTKTGVPITQMPSPDPDDCDKPVQLALSGGEGQCVPYARFQRLTPNNPDVETVVICRKYHFTSGPDDPTFHDIALIQHHKTTGATCYFQSPVDTQPFLDGTHVPSPQEDSATARRYWLEPQRSARSSGPGAIRCTGCHDADPFIWSPYIIQVAHPENWNPLGAWDSNFQSLFGSPVSTFRPDTNRCTTCHRFGSEICKKDDAGMGHVSVQEAATNLWMPPDFAGSAQEWNSTFAADLQKIFDCCANLQLAVCHTREATGH
jgi:hypothetical protein